MFLKPKEKGFTLIELLVVIAIIGLLSSIVLVSISRSRDKASDTAAKEQVRQVKTALELYFADHGYYPGIPGTTVNSVDNKAEWDAIKTALSPQYISSIPEKRNQAYVYTSISACGAGVCSYTLTAEVVLSPPSPPDDGGDNEPIDPGDDTGGLPPGDIPGPVGTEPEGGVYYVDSIGGNDANDGKTQSTAWKTIGKVNSSMNLFDPGDKILFARGAIWNQKLIVTKSGTSGEPLTFGSYGSGAKPVIDLQNGSDFGVLVWGFSNIVISGLEIRNAKNDSGPSAGIGIANSKNIVVDGVTVRDVKGLGGVYVFGESPAATSDIVIKNSIITNTRGTTFSQSAAGGYNKGIGIQLWANCETCGQNIRVEGNTINGNGSHGIGIFMPRVIVKNNTIFNNNNSGITGAMNGANSWVAGTLVEGNDIYGNCRTTDDCFGINMFRTAGNNSIRNNTLRGQHDTKNDPTILVNQGYEAVGKLGTGGIRFDGGDFYSRSIYGAGYDYSEHSGNVISGNTISNEYDGVQIFNYSTVTIQGNTISGSRRADIWLGADNTASGGNDKAIMVTLSGNTPSGLNVVTYGPVTMQ